jgi:hypothetical protein
MSDPRLNSVHLDPVRRQEFRRAREELLHARGWQTIAGEQHIGVGTSRGNDNTIIPKGEDRAPPGLKYWLIDRDYVYPLKVGLNTVGRAPDNDVVVQDAYVSRRHCAILVHAGDGCELHDTASKNGTYLNGRKLAGPTRLNPGDEIRMCDQQFIFMSRNGDPGDSGHLPTLSE